MIVNRWGALAAPPLSVTTTSMVAVPLLVAEALLDPDRRKADKTRAAAGDSAAKAGASVPETDALKDTPAPGEVPEVFLRAFDE